MGSTMVALPASRLRSGVARAEITPPPFEGRFIMRRAPQGAKVRVAGEPHTALNTARVRAGSSRGEAGRPGSMPPE